VKVHGFAMTSHKLMMRYPWYSVDSKSWISFGSYGQIIMPNKKDGKWNYQKSYHIVRLSVKNSEAFNKTSMVNINNNTKKLFLQYIEEKGFVLGKSKMIDGKEIIIEKGLCNDDKQRCDLNALYFLDLTNHLPTWPWSFRKPTKELGL